MNGNIFLMAVLCVVSVLYARRPEKVDNRSSELEALKNQVALERDSLQREIAQRWHDRQRAVEQREMDKEEIATLLEKQEKAFSSVVGVKEEGFALERQLEDALKTVDEKKQEWRYIQSAITDVLEKEGDYLSGFFPIDIDSTRIRLGAIKRNFSKRNNSIATITELTRYAVRSIERGTLMTIHSATVLPDGEQPRSMTVARFGTVFGYGMGDDGSMYVIGQSGREGADRYRVRRIENPVLQQRLVDGFNNWVTAKRPVGNVTIDIMQSDLSGRLITGKVETISTRMKHFVKAGGPVMVPLGLLPLWALILIILKLIQYIGRRTSIRNLFRRVDTFFEKNDVESARTFIAQRKNAAARTVSACINISEASRQAAENAAKEVLYTETSRLGAHLNTLAVIAGVAPLLGLLGTVTGMIRLFEVITRFGTGDPKLLAGGISEALITTEIGLIIAVPVLLMHNFLRNYKNKITAELHIGALRIINRLYPEV